MPYKKARSTRRTVKRKVLKTKRSYSVPKTIKQYVKRVISRNVEMKRATPLSFSNQPILPYYWATANCSTVVALNVPILGLTRGTGAGQFIGNEIKVKQYTFKGFINLDSERANQTGYLKNPTFIRMVICRKKTDELNVTNMNDFMQLGSNYTSPQNLPPDMWRKLNTDSYQIVGERRFKIGTSAPSNNPADSSQWNNDFKFSGSFSFDLTKHCGRYVKFDAAGDPINQNLCAVFLMSYANGAIMSNTGLPPIELHGDVEFHYEDA